MKYHIKLSLVQNLCELDLLLYYAHYVIIHIKSVVNKDKNHYYCKIFLDKSLYQLANHNHKILFIV